MAVTDARADEPDVELVSRCGRIVITTVILGSAVAMLTATVVNVALPTLARDLDADAAGQKWIINGYTLTLASLVLIGGSLGDRFGRVAVYRVGVAWFALASLLCAVAWNVDSLIVFRMLQGVGGALLTPGSLAIIQATLREQDRGRGVGLWSGLGGVAGAIGPLLGGLLVELSWRWVFVVNVPVAVGVLVLTRWIPETRDPTAKDSPLDGGGAILTAAVLGGSSFALIEGPEGGWSPLEVTAAIGSLVALVALWFVERGRDHAMLPLELFRNRTFAVANGLTFTVYGGMGVLFFLLSVQLQVTAGWSPLAAGTALLPVTIILLFLSARMGELSSRIGARIPLTIGSITVGVGMWMTIRIGPDAEFLTDVLPAVVVFGLGLACIVAPVTSTALGAVPADRAGAASGVNNAVARAGGLLAVAAIPGFVGLTGDALGDPAQLDEGFEQAMIVAGSVVALSGLIAFLFLPGRAFLASGTRRFGVGLRHRTHANVHHHTCPVDGRTTSVTELASVGAAADGEGPDG